MAKDKLFAEMIPDEADKFESECNAIILHNDSTQVDVPSFALQKCKGNDDAIAVQIDGIDDVILLADWQVKRLKEWINTNF